MTDPELDLLRELLEEDPGADVFIEVGRELSKRQQWADAAGVLQAGLEHNPDDQSAWDMLARAAVAAGLPIVALGALERLSPTPERHPELVRLEVMSLAAIGQVERAALLGESLVLLHPSMGPIESLLSSASMSAPMAPAAEEPLIRSADPRITEAVAEQYAAAGRVDRAIRVYRRLLFRNPKHRGLRERLAILQGRPHDDAIDDLSEEIPDPSQFPPPALEMPKMYDNTEEITVLTPRPPLAAPVRAADFDEEPTLNGPVTSEVPYTDEVARPLTDEVNRPRRRRSILNKR